MSSDASERQRAATGHAEAVLVETLDCLRDAVALGSQREHMLGEVPYQIAAADPAGQAQNQIGRCVSEVTTDIEPVSAQIGERDGVADDSVQGTMAKVGD